ncbi:hypothetical protein RQP46_000126 [Phenoliferia psychrophenolica]
MDLLPLELVNFVLDLLVPNSLTEGPTTDERKTLRTCCLVHSTWRARLQPSLFRCIGGAPTRTPRQLERLLASIQARPVLATHIHELQIGDNGSSPWSKIVSTKFELKLLSLVGGAKLVGNTDDTSSMPGFSSLIKLNLDIDDNPSESAGLRSIIRAPNVRTLGLGTDRYDGLLFGRQLERLFDHDLSKVEYFDISRSSESDHDWDDILPRFTSLRTFCIAEAQVDLLHLGIPSTVETISFDLTGVSIGILRMSPEFSGILGNVLEPNTFLPKLASIYLTHPDLLLDDLVEAEFIREGLLKRCRARGIVLEVRPLPTHGDENTI